MRRHVLEYQHYSFGYPLRFFPTFEETSIVHSGHLHYQCGQTLGGSWRSQEALRTGAASVVPDSMTDPFHG